MHTADRALSRAWPTPGSISPTSRPTIAKQMSSSISEKPGCLRRAGHRPGEVAMGAPVTGRPESGRLLRSPVLQAIGPRLRTVENEAVFQGAGANGLLTAASVLRWTCSPARQCGLHDPPRLYSSHRRKAQSDGAGLDALRYSDEANRAIAEFTSDPCVRFTTCPPPSTRTSAFTARHGMMRSRRAVK